MRSPWQVVRIEIQTVDKEVEVPQIQIVDKIIEVRARRARIGERWQGLATAKSDSSFEVRAIPLLAVPVLAVPVLMNGNCRREC